MATFINSVFASVCVSGSKVTVGNEDGVLSCVIYVQDKNGQNVCEREGFELAIPAHFEYPIKVDVTVYGGMKDPMHGVATSAHAEIKTQLKDRFSFSTMKTLKERIIAESEEFAKGAVTMAQALGFEAKQYCTLRGAVDYVDVEFQDEEVWSVCVWDVDNDHVFTPPAYKYETPLAELIEGAEDEDYLGATPSVFAKAAKAAPCVDPVAQYEKYQD